MLSFLIILGIFPAVYFSATEVNAVETQKSIHLIIQKKDERYNIEKIDIILEKGVYQRSYESFKGKASNGVVVSFKNENLGYFPVSNNLEISFCEDSINTTTGKMIGECQDLTEGELTIDAPYFPNGKYADIYDPFGKRVLTIDLSSKATCNENDKCDQPIEDGENCPQDCVKGEPKLDPVVVAEAQKQSATENISTASNKWLLITAVMLLALAGLGFWLWKRYRKYKDEAYK